MSRILNTLALSAAVCAPMAASAEESRAVPTDYHFGHIVDQGRMQVGRYTTAAARPEAEASNPLDVYVQITYPRQTVATVGDAIRHTLMRSGWNLVDRSALSPQAVHLLTLPLPDSQRTLGPYSLRTVLSVLTGRTWAWQEDAVRRLVWFGVAADVEAAAQGNALQQVGSGVKDAATKVADSAPGQAIPGTPHIVLGGQ